VPVTRNSCPCRWIGWLDAHPVVQAHIERIDCREHPAVPAPDVEVRHGVYLGRLATRLHVKGVEQEAEVPIHLTDVRVLALGVGHPHAHHAHGHLYHFIRMWVVHEGAGAPCLELVHIGLAYGDGALIQTADAVHSVGQALTMPVNCGVLRQLVGHKDAHAVTLNDFNGRPRTLAVVAPHVDLEARRDFANHGFGHQMEFLDVVVHAPRQGPAVEGHHGVVRATGCRDQRRRRFHRRLHDRLWQTRQGGSRHGQAGHGGCGTCKKLAPGVGIGIGFGHVLCPFNALLLPGHRLRRPPDSQNWRALRLARPTEDRLRRARSRVVR
jgi:hypothetical protein